MTDDNQDFANGLRALQGSKIPLEDEMRILARIKAMRTTQEVVEWVYGLEQALIRLRDCDWVITPADRMDAVRNIARAALKER